MKESKTAENPRKKYGRRIEQALALRKKQGYDDRWMKFTKTYAFQWEYPEIAAAYDDVVAVNLAFSGVNVIIPSIAVNYPKITVTASKPQDETRAPTVEAAANYMWRRWDAHDEFRRGITDSTIMGIGWIKTTWEYVESQEPLTIEEWQVEVQRALVDWQQAMAQGLASGLTEADFPSQEEVIKAVPRTKTVVVSDRPVVQRVSPYDVIVDPDATRMSEMRWIDHRMFIPLEVAKADKRFDAKARASLKGTSMSEARREHQEVDALGGRTEDADYVVIHEYWDIINGQVCTFSEGCDEYLIEPSPFPYSFGQPFIPIEAYAVPERFYPVGDIEAMMSQQEELALLRTQMSNDRKRFMRKTLLRSGALSAKGLAALQSPHDNEFVEVDSDEDFGRVMAALPHNPLPPEFYGAGPQIIEDINTQTGLTEYQRGATAEIRRTATEAGFMQDGANARSADRLAKIERMIGEVAQRVVKLCQQFLSTEMVAKIVGDDQVVTWVNYAREDIAGEYDFAVEAGSTQPQNESSRRQSAMQLMDAMAPFISMGVVNAQALADHVLRNGFGVKDTSQFIMQPPPPMDPMAQGVPPQ